MERNVSSLDFLKLLILDYMGLSVHFLRVLAFSLNYSEDLLNFVHDYRKQWGTLFELGGFSVKILNQNLQGIKS